MKGITALNSKHQSVINQNFSFKRGVLSYSFNVFNHVTRSCDLEHVTKKAYHVFVGDTFLCFMVKCDILQDWSCFVDAHSEMLCGGTTMKECKESLTRVYFRHISEDNLHMPLTLYPNN
jgi:hypothetical protein